MTQVNPALNDHRGILLELQHELEKLHPQIIFLADAISKGDEDEEIANGASFLLLGLAEKIKTMTERAAATFLKENLAT